MLSTILFCLIKKYPNKSLHFGMPAIAMIDWVLTYGILIILI